MANDSHRAPASVDELQTAEFTVPEGTAEAEELTASAQAPRALDSAPETRALIAAAVRELAAPGNDDRRKAAIHHSLGLLIENRLGDVRQAAAHYEEACRLAPGTVVALRSARRTCWSRQNWAMVLRLLDDERGRISNPARAATLLLQKGRIHEDWLVSMEEAEECYREALRLDASNRQVLYRLRRLLWRKQDYPGLIDICRRAAATTRDRKYRGLLLGEMGRILDGKLGEVDAAIATYSAAFVEDPSLAFVRAALKRLCHEHSRWRELADVLLTEGDLGGADGDRVQAYLTAARLYRDRLGQGDRSLEILSRVRRICPSDATILQEIADLLEHTGQYADLADVYHEMLESLHDTSERVAAHYRLGQVLEERLDQEDEAIVHYRRAVSLDPTYVPALRALGKLCQRRGHWAELIGMNAAEAEAVVDGEARAVRYHGLAEQCETQLGDLPRAIEYHRRALAACTHFGPSERALERLFTTTEDWQALADMHESRLELFEGEELGRQLAELGRLWEERLKDPERAVDHYRRGLEHLPDELSILRALQRLYAEAGRHEDLLQTLDREIERTSDTGSVVALMHKAAEICETKLDNVDEAVTRYKEILLRAPAHWVTLTSLGRIYHRQAKWQEVLALYQVEAEQQGIQPERLGSLHFKIGEIYLEHLGNDDAALAAYAKATAVFPNYLPALQGLGRLHRKREDWEKLLEVMRRQAEVQSVPEQKAMSLYSIGDLYETHLGQAGVAIQYYRQALEVVPGHEISLSALLRNLVADNRWREVTDLYARALSAAVDDRSRVFILKRLGEIWNQRLLNSSKAVECYEEALALSGEDLETLDALSRLYLRIGAYPRLAAIYERLAFRAKDAAEATSFLHEAAWVLEVHLPEQDTARVYEEILRRHPEDILALEALERIHHASTDPKTRVRISDAHAALEDDPASRSALLFELAEARQAAGDLLGAVSALAQAAELVDDFMVTYELRRLREQLGQWDLLAKSLEKQAEIAQDKVLVVESLMRAATLYQERLQDQDRAVSALTRVLENDPLHHQAAVRLEQILVRREAWSEVVEVLRRRLEHPVLRDRPSRVGVAQAQIELLTRMAWIQREHLQQPSEAVAALSKCIQLDPNHLPTLHTLGELLWGMEQWQEAVDTYSRIVAVSDDPELLRSAHLRLGELLGDRLGDSRRAISSYQNVLANAPSDVTAIGKLFDLFAKDRDWENAADMVSRLIEIEREPQRLVAHRAALADIHEKGFGDSRLAAEQLQHALAIDPTNEAILSRFARLCAHLGEWERVADAIRSFLVALPSDQESRGIAHRVQLAEILWRRLGRPREALEQVRAAVEIDPTHVEARLAAAAILVEGGCPEEAIAEHREVQSIDRVNVTSLGQMRAIWSRTGNHDMAYAAATALCCLGQAHEEDEQIYQERRSKGIRHPRAPVDSGLFDQHLVHPGEDRTGRAILAALGEVAHRIRASRLTEWQVAKTDRLPPRSEDPLRTVVREVGDLLGLEHEVDIFVSPVRPREMDLLLTDPPSLVAGAGIAMACSAAELRCWVGYLLSYVRNRTWVAYGADGGELGKLICAACMAVEPPVQVACLGQPTEDVGELARGIQRNLSRRGRRALDDACRSLGSAREVNVDEWAVAMHHTGLRVGLWVASDLEAAWAHLRRMDPALATKPSDGEASLGRVRSSPLATELLHFWLSHEYFSLRQATLR
jgi:tetratricopeptide (TPR) repeat protein